MRRAAGRAGSVIGISGESEHVPLTWDELRPYEQQQGGYWLYGTDPFGADKRWIPVEATS